MYEVSLVRAEDAVPSGRLGETQAACQCRFNFPHLCRGKIPQAAGLRWSAGHVTRSSIFGWATAAARRLCRDWRVDAGSGADVLRHEIGMLAQAVTLLTQKPF